MYVCALLVSCAGTYSKCYMFERSDSLSNPSISSYFPSLPSCFFLPSFLPPFLPSVLPHHSPVTWYSYNPLRHVLMLFFFLFLLSVECWYSPTHSLSLHLSKSLTPSISTFPRERESEQKRERERALLNGLVFLWQPLCESAVCLSLFVHCVASKDVMIMCLCALLVCTFICSTVHLFCQMKSKYCISMYL